MRWFEALSYGFGDLIQSMFQEIKKQTLAFTLLFVVASGQYISHKWETAERDKREEKIYQRVVHLENRVESMQNNQTYIMSGALRVSSETNVAVLQGLSEIRRYMEKHDK